MNVNERYGALVAHDVIDYHQANLRNEIPTLTAAVVEARKGLGPKNPDVLRVHKVVACLFGLLLTACFLSNPAADKLNDLGLSEQASSTLAGGGLLAILLAMINIYKNATSFRSPRQNAIQQAQQKLLNTKNKISLLNDPGSTIYAIEKAHQQWPGVAADKTLLHLAMTGTLPSQTKL